MTVAPLTPDAPMPGTSIEGRYVVGEVIGRGGGGIVCAGHHLSLDAPVAIKFLKASELPRDARKRFIREARLANRLRSEHSTRVYDVGELPTGELYLVMERLYGQSLETELAARGPLPEHEAAELMACACEALAEAHALGITHRDIKPGNLFLHHNPAAPPGRTLLKVLDFGLSREVDRADGPAHTRTFMFLGTPRYMPPEQWEPGVPADPRMDIYALGVVLHELLTGKVPFEELSPQDRATAILSGAVPDPRARRPEISARMAEVVVGCVKPRPEDRVPSTRHLERLLRALATSGEGAGGATLLLSNAVRTKMMQTPSLPATPPQRTSPPPRLKPTYAIQRDPMAEPLREASPPQDPALGAAEAQPHGPLAGAQVEDDEDDERGPLDKAIVIVLVVILVVLAGLGVAALLQATGRL